MFVKNYIRASLCQGQINFNKKNIFLAFIKLCTRGHKIPLTYLIKITWFHIKIGYLKFVVPTLTCVMKEEKK